MYFRSGFEFVGWSSFDGTSGDGARRCLDRSTAGRNKYVAGVTSPENIKDAQNIQRHPSKSVRIPPKMRPILRASLVRYSGNYTRA